MIWNGRVVDSKIARDTHVETVNWDLTILEMVETLIT